MRGHFITVCTYIRASSTHFTISRVTSGPVSVHGAESLDRFSAVSQPANHMVPHTNWGPQPDCCWGLSPQPKIQRVNLFYWEGKYSFSAAAPLSTLLNAIKRAGFYLFLVRWWPLHYHYWDCFSSLGMATAFQGGNRTLQSLCDLSSEPSPPPRLFTLLSPSFPTY